MAGYKVYHAEVQEVERTGDYPNLDPVLDLPRIDGAEYVHIGDKFYLVGEVLTLTFGKKRVKAREPRAEMAQATVESEHYWPS